MRFYQESGADLTRYLAEARRVPELTREAERELAERFRLTGDRAAAEQLARAHFRHVLSCALKYRRYGLPLSELVAEGNFGVARALVKFEPERGIRFATYAAFWVRAYILDYVIQSWSIVGGGSGPLRSRVFFKLRRERVKVHNLLGEGEESERALAERIQVSRPKLRAMIARLDARDLSLDAAAFDDSASTLLDRLVSGDDQEQRYLEQQSERARRVVVSDALSALDPRERYIVEQRLMADAAEELSLAEIGRKLGVSRERARQLEERTKKKLRARIPAEHAPS
jgi:RNA polymerase sigma-32 factor